jgi:hypothetical protein
MASYLPPTENLPIFDNQVFSTNDIALTYTEARKYFVTFPSAQGTSTITDFITGTINYLSPSAGSFFDIGANQVSGGHIRVGPTGTSGVSIHVGNIDFKNNTINNATDPALNNITIGHLQTSGVLNIGTGARTTTGNGGAINIGSTSTNSAPINIGGVNSAAITTSSISTSTISLNGNRLWSTMSGEGSIRTGGTLTLTSSNSADVNIATESFSDIYIGPGGSTKNVNLRPNLLLSLPITLPTSTTTPTTTQLGYIGRAYNGSLVQYSSGGVGTDIVNTGTVLAIGIYQMNWTVSVNNWTNGTSAYMNFSFNTSGSIIMNGVPQTAGNIPPTAGSDFIMQLQGVTNSATQFATFNFSCIVKSTAASSEINLRGKINSGTNTATTQVGYAQVTWLKIG